MKLEDEMGNFLGKVSYLRKHAWWSLPQTTLLKQISQQIFLYPASIYMFKDNNKNSRTRFEICSKLTIETPERRHWFSAASLFKYVWPFSGH